MAWTLQFYRRVGEPDLTLKEVEEFFEARPDMVRSEAETPTGMLPILRFESAEVSPGFAFSFTTEKQEEDPRPDFAYEETGLSLTMDLDLSHDRDSKLDELMAVLRALTSKLQLEISDPQVEQLLPGPLDEHRLQQSYDRRRTEIIETVQYFEARKKRLLTIGSGLLLTAIILAILMAMNGQFP